MTWMMIESLLQHPRIIARSTLSGFKNSNILPCAVLSLMQSSNMNLDAILKHEPKSLKKKSKL